MSHYNPKDRSVKLRCDGDHDWGSERMDTSSVDVVLEEGEICLEIEWRTIKSCTNDYTNDVQSAKQTCQAVTTVKSGSETVPVKQLTSTDKEINEHD